jgi:hypothetical protein
MTFLRRLLGGGDRPPADGGADVAPTTDAELEEEERAHELELARFEQDRTTDLVRRQQRYGDKSWQPPAQGGSRRADEGSDGEADAGGGGR